MKKAKDFQQIYLYRDPIDMRKQILGISRIVEDLMQQNPFDEGILYVFNNRKKDIIKALYFQGAGFCLWNRRLDQGKFPWPRKIADGQIKINAADLDLVLDGVDVFKRHQKLDFDSLD